MTLIYAAGRMPYELTDEERERYAAAINGHRGFLSNYPDDVIAVVNGHPVTKGNVLDGKRRKQRLLLDWKLKRTEPFTVPCFVWVFDNGPIIPYGGSWLYVRTLRKSWQLGPRYSRGHSYQSEMGLTMRVMRLFPCGYLPMIENFGVWKRAFVRAYHRPTVKRPKSNGLALARAVVSPDGSLLDVIELEGD